MKTVDISGMGGSYEDCCQKMLLNGIRYLKEHPEFDFKVYHSYKGIYGVMEGEGQSAKDLDAALTVGVGGGTTGAQHQAVISHLAHIHTHSYDQWLEELKGAGRDLIEAKTDEELDRDLKKADEEWQAKLATGYDWTKELMDKLPPENIIRVNMDDPGSVKKAGEAIAKIVKEGE